MKSEEINFDGLVGPTHHFGGHAYGNLSCMKHQHHASNPKQAALQCLEKMKRLFDLGIPQAVLPPRMRPSISTLRALGYKGTDAAIHARVARENPDLLYTLSSASSMWAANSATVAPSCDTYDAKVHITVANLQSNFHRAIEALETYQLFRSLFSNEDLFSVHPPLPHGGHFGDEGAANHLRFCKEYGEKGVHVFVYDQSAFDRTAHQFPFRQAKEASEAIARLHGLDPQLTFYLQQNPVIIESGVIHNDVISTGNQRVFLYHEKAYVKGEAPKIDLLKERAALDTICITEQMLSFEKAFESYLFNSQLVTLPTGKPLLLAPKECTALNLEFLPFDIEYINVEQSLLNGGGPACLRLRIVMNEKEKNSVHPSIFLSDALYLQLRSWIEKHFRDSLILNDLKDPHLLREVQESLDEISQILHLGSCYEFQKL